MSNVLPLRKMPGAYVPPPPDVPIPCDVEDLCAIADPWSRGEDVHASVHRSLSAVQKWALIALACVVAFGLGMLTVSGL